ncbi:hypothetical protein CPB85DRAFT_258185 [Mucidula mucida]|nr:hypothetical protein CPB85DRAFT_258185 [Mucidula mucida]
MTSKAQYIPRALLKSSPSPAPIPYPCNTLTTSFNSIVFNDSGSNHPCSASPIPFPTSKYFKCVKPDKSNTTGNR